MVEGFPDGRKLTPSDPYVTANDRVFVEKVSQLVLVFGKAVVSKEEPSVVWAEIRDNFHEIVVEFLKISSIVCYFADGISDSEKIVYIRNTEVFREIV